MDEQEGYDCEFFKDSRNRQGDAQTKKRLNVKEVKKRAAQINKRAEQVAQKEEPATFEFEEGDERKKKYDNGKPVRQVKTPECWVDSEGEGRTQGKKGGKSGGSKKSKK